MRTAKHSYTGLLVALLLGAAACTGNGLDNGGSPNVVLEIVPPITTPAVTGTIQQGTCSVTGNPCLSNDNCPVGEACILPPVSGTCTIPQWTVNIANIPKIPLANSVPFNDVTLETMRISFVWNNALGSQALAAVPLGVSIHPNQIAAIAFFPINQEMIQALAAVVPSGSGASAAVTMVFEGRTQDGSPISVTGGSVLQIAACF